MTSCNWIPNAGTGYDICAFFFTHPASSVVGPPASDSHQRSNDPREDSTSHSKKRSQVLAGHDESIVIECSRCAERLCLGRLRFPCPSNRENPKLASGLSVPHIPRFALTAVLQPGFVCIDHTELPTDTTDNLQAALESCGQLMLSLRYITSSKSG